MSPEALSVSVVGSQAPSSVNGPDDAHEVEVVFDDLSCKPRTRQTMGTRSEALSRSQGDERHAVREEICGVSRCLDGEPCLSGAAYPRERQQQGRRLSKEASLDLCFLRVSRNITVPKRARRAVSSPKSTRLRERHEAAPRSFR